MLSRTHAVTDWARRSRVAARSVRTRPQLADRRRDLAAQLDRLPPPPPLAGPVVVVHLGPAPEHGVDRPAELIDLSHQPTSNAINEAVATSPNTTVCLVGPTARSLRAGWLEHLVGALGSGVVAATPLVVHPERPPTAATPHDLLVRWSGLDVAVSPDGSPRAVARRSGEAPDLTAPGEEVIGAPSTVLVVERAAWDRAGGLADDLPYDAAIFDLGIRLRAAGNALVAVSAAAMVDVRPVNATIDLDGPLAPEASEWRSLVDRHGPRLVSEAPGPASSPMASIAITTATPSQKLAPRSGDWHFAGLFAAALRRAGHRVVLQSIEEADSLAGRSCDVHLVLRGLEPVRRTPGQRHVLWIISHPEAIDSAEYDDADLVLVASERFAQHLRGLTDTPVEVMLQATDPSFFHPGAATAEHRHPVTVVANTRGVMRRAVADAIAGGLAPAIYGQGWSGLVDPSAIVGDYVAFESLPAVYASAGVVLNDHWDTMLRWGFVSNRIFDVAASGTPVISDHLPEIADLFGPLVPTWSTPGELRSAVELLQADPEATAKQTAELRHLVVDRHTFDHRVAQLAELLDFTPHVPGTGFD